MPSQATTSQLSPTAGSTRKKKAQAPLVRTYVLDTSVLLADPGALRRFAEHEVVLPVVVITELEGKRHHPELGYFARTALRLLDELRVTHGRLDNAVPVGEEGGSIRVELNHTDPGSLPSGFRLGDNDTRILAVAKNLADEGAAVTLVSKDLPLRIKASAVGLDAEEYRGETISESDPGYSGMAEMDVLASDLDELYDDGVIDLGEARDMPCHQGLVLLSDRGTALARVGADKRVHLLERAAARTGTPPGGVAQLVAHLHGMQRVRGSSPLTSTRSGRPSRTRRPSAISGQPDHATEGRLLRGRPSACPGLEGGQSRALRCCCSVEPAALSGLRAHEEQVSSQPIPVRLRRHIVAMTSSTSHVRRAVSCAPSAARSSVSTARSTIRS